jgi:nitrilase
MLTDEGVKAQNTQSGALMSSAGGGSSAIFGPDGRRLTEPLGDKEEGIIYADLDLDEITRNKMFAHCTGHYSRPDILWLSTDNNVKNTVRAIKESVDELSSELQAL